MMLVIFDCDGVLVDSEPVANRILARHLRNRGLAFTDQRVQQEFRGRSAAGCIAHMHQWMSAADAEACWQALQAETLQALADVSPVPGVLELLALLDQKHQPFCVASSGGHEKMAVTLSATGIRQRFNPNCYSVTEVAAAKPAPDVFLHAADKMGFAPSECVVVEDSYTGVAAGVAAGMPVFWYGGEACKCVAGEVIGFSHMDELPGLWRARGWVL